MAFCKAMTHILFLATTLLICNILSFIIESQVFCLAIFIYMFSFCINKTMIYFKFFSFSLLRSRASKFFVRTSEFLGALALQDKFERKFRALVHLRHMNKCRIFHSIHSVTFLLYTFAYLSISFTSALYIRN